MRFIGVTGSREWTDEKAVYEILDRLLQKYIYVTIVAGEARGADKIAKKWALEHKNYKFGVVNYLPYPANWRPNGPNGIVDKTAGFKRNQLIVDRSDELVAFLIKRLPCNGTKDTIEKATRAEKRVTIIEA